MENLVASVRKIRMMQDKLIPYSTSLKHNMDIEHENWKFGNNPCNF